jgi:hypothetical protein
VGTALPQNLAVHLTLLCTQYESLRNVTQWLNEMMTNFYGNDRIQLVYLGDIATTTDDGKPWSIQKDSRPLAQMGFSAK